jgi:hypothetical protein
MNIIDFPYELLSYIGLSLTPLSLYQFLQTNSHIYAIMDKHFKNAYINKYCLVLRDTSIEYLIMNRLITSFKLNSTDIDISKIKPRTHSTEQIAARGIRILEHNIATECRYMTSYSANSELSLKTLINVIIPACDNKNILHQHNNLTLRTIQCYAWDTYAYIEFSTKHDIGAILRAFYHNNGTLHILELYKKITMTSNEDTSSVKLFIVKGNKCKDNNCYCNMITDVYDNNIMLIYTQYGIRYKYIFPCLVTPGKYDIKTFVNINEMKLILPSVGCSYEYANMLVDRLVNINSKLEVIEPEHRYQKITKHYNNKRPKQPFMRQKVRQNRLPRRRYLKMY